MLAHLHIGRLLAQQAERWPERQPLAERFMRRTADVCALNARRIMRGDRDALRGNRAVARERNGVAPAAWPASAAKRSTPRRCACSPRRATTPRRCRTSPPPSASTRAACTTTSAARRSCWRACSSAAWARCWTRSRHRGRHVAVAAEPPAASHPARPRRGGRDNREALTVYLHEFRALAGEALDSVREQRDAIAAWSNRVVERGVRSGEFRRDRRGDRHAGRAGHVQLDRPVVPSGRTTRGRPDRRPLRRAVAARALLRPETSSPTRLAESVNQPRRVAVADSVQRLLEEAALRRAGRQPIEHAIDVRRQQHRHAPDQREAQHKLDHLTLHI